MADVLARFAEDADAKVRRAAFDALGTVGGQKQVPALLRCLAGAKSDSERDEVASALEGLCSRAKEQALGPVLAGMNDASPASRVALLRVLSFVGGAKALAAVRAAAKDPEVQVKDAAVRALTDWTDPAAAPDLVGIIRTSDSNAHRVLAFRGYVRLGRESEASAAVRLKMLAEAISLARDAQEKKRVVGALGEISSVEALKLVAGQLTDPELADEAGAAAVSISARLEARHKADIEAVLKQVVAAAKATSVINDAQRQMHQLGGK